MLFRQVISIALLICIVGCSGRGHFEFNVYSAGYYEGAEPVNEKPQFQNHTKNAWFGPYRIRQKTGRYTGGIREFYDKGNLPEEQINAWWQVHYKNKPDKFFYARSLPSQGIQAEKMHFWSDWKHYAYISFGPMYINSKALTAAHKEEYLKLLEVSEWSGVHYYAWGKEDSFYYVVNKDRVDPQNTPRNWIEVPGIAITKTQFELLDQRCGKPWLKTRCFMDESFPDLTPEQIEYIRSHKHEDDDYWLSDKATPPKVEKRVNPWL